MKRIRRERNEQLATRHKDTRMIVKRTQIEVADLLEKQKVEQNTLIKFLKYSLGYRPAKPDSKNKDVEQEINPISPYQKITEQQLEEEMSKSFTNYHSHCQKTPMKKKRATTKAFETNRRLTIHELASTNYIGVKE